jgi:predicted deacylase
MSVENEYPVEVSAPDLSAYRVGNVGTDYVIRLESDRPGPHVLVTALVHGNEICGAIALDFLLRQAVRPQRGVLTLAFANVAAYRRFDPKHPSLTRFVDEDFNRVWSPEVLEGARRSVELDRARALRPFVDAADYLFDIHSMQLPTEPMMMCGPLAQGRDFAVAVGIPAVIVSDEGHAGGKRVRDYGGFGDPASPKNALLIECGQHWAASSALVAKQALVQFLRHFDMIAPELAEGILPPTPAPTQRVIEVTAAITARSERFRFARDYQGLEVIGRAGTVIAQDGEELVTTPYDDCVLIMPSRRLGPGLTAVRLGRYVA